MPLRIKKIIALTAIGFSFQVLKTTNDLRQEECNSNRRFCYIVFDGSVMSAGTGNGAAMNHRRLHGAAKEIFDHEFVRQIDFQLINKLLPGGRDLQCGDVVPSADDIVVSPLSVSTTPATHDPLSLDQAIKFAEETGRRNVYLSGGTYFLERSLFLKQAVDGITLSACPGETPVLRTRGDYPAIVLSGVARAKLTGLTFLATTAPVQVSLDGAENCTLLSNVFFQSRTALLLDHAVNNRIQGNLFVDSAESAIEMRDGSDANFVADNIVDGTRAPETHGGGIFLHGVKQNRVSHNLVQNTDGFGIGILNWDEATINTGNVVEYNVVLNTAMTAEDSGAIYVLGRSAVDTETVIAGNIVDGVGAPSRHTVGIYLDDSTSGAVVIGNIVRRAGSDAVQIHGGSDNLIENNLLDVSQGRPSAVLFQAAPADTNPLNAQTGNLVAHNVILSSNRNPKLFVWFDGGTPSIHENLYADTSGAVLLPASPVADTSPLTADRSIALEGIHGRYGPAVAAAQRAMRFRPIDALQAGPRAPAQRHTNPH